ncbi:hypothetical protein DXT99_26645 [Pontibacter diazotrophicus]|uniref:Uncharacterized protein n=1 Tax=Pontibacter diazotrophicus TaxID=1400979 RepID=A0A3D8KYG4_9BACT|nr:hypothetical protein [Pontibacter diazotrophicus]RDV10254.1 hypothetical protein DXT99_26645 [Pontibacter diazotrophicus]
MKFIKKFNSFSVNEGFDSREAEGRSKFENMNNKDFDMSVEYDRWNVELKDVHQNQTTTLKSKPNGWFSNYYSGSTNIDNTDFNIERNSKGIVLNANQSVIGNVKTSKFGFFGREAIIILSGEKYILKRESLPLKFVVLNEQREVIINITGFVDRKKQANLFSLIYSPSKLLYSVHLQKELEVSTTTLFLLLVCGYCTELFNEIDRGE